MKTIRATLLALIAATMLAAPHAAARDAAPADAERPVVEVVFVLDTTGSMSGLIEGAKVKIWKIVNQIVSGDPVPDVRVGLVPYRDRKDAYVTKHFGLTTDLDKVYGILQGFSAGGGGDTPESVNEALHVALTKTAWGADERTLKLIYLVGDAPPKMGYQDDVKYTVTCEAAAKAGVIINSVQCGGMAETTRVWQEIARKAEGRYTQIDQSGGMTVVATPYDARISELSDLLGKTALFYGDERVRASARQSLDEAEDGVAGAPAEAKAERAGFLAKSGRYGAADLLSLFERGDLKLEDVEEDKLPKELKELTAEERAAKVKALLEERTTLRKELLALDGKRADHIRKELAASGGEKDAFDASVLQALKEQAGKIGVKYE